MKLYWVYIISILPLWLTAQDCAFYGSKAIAVPAAYSQNKGDIELHIAIVIHIVELVGSQYLVSERMIHDQIAVLNRDFNARNHEWKGVSREMNKLATSANIHFFLPTLSFDGTPSRGITRTITTREDLWSTGDIYSTMDGGQDAWPGNQYLNVWVVDLPEKLLGFSSSPGDIGERFDGVVINSRAFGLRPENKTSGFGRSLVHEIGHYLGLLHPWGVLDGECEEDDGIADTPPQLGAHSGCPPAENKGCNTSDPIYWNFMDYTGDCCMALFTKGQVTTMRYVLENQRFSLANFGAEISKDESQMTFLTNITIYPNPASELFSVDWTSLILEEDVFFQSLSFYDMCGRKVVSMPLSSERRRVEFCTNSLPKGVYILLLQKNDGEIYNAGKLSIY